MNPQNHLLTADEAVYDLTLALLYLQRVSNNPVKNPANNIANNQTNNTDSDSAVSPVHYWDVTTFKSSTSYDPEILGWLQEVGFVSNYKKYRGNGSNGSGGTVSTSANNFAKTEAQIENVLITKAGVLRAREILNTLGISDWDKAEILKNEESSAYIVHIAHKESNT